MNCLKNSLVEGGAKAGVGERTGEKAEVGGQKTAGKIVELLLPLVDALDKSLASSSSPP